MSAVKLDVTWASPTTDADGYTVWKGTATVGTNSVGDTVTLPEAIELEYKEKQVPAPEGTTGTGGGDLVDSPDTCWDGDYLSCDYGDSGVMIFSTQGSSTCHASAHIFARVWTPTGVYGAVFSRGIACGRVHAAFLANTGHSWNIAPIFGWIDGACAGAEVEQTNCY